MRIASRTLLAGCLVLGLTANTSAQFRIPDEHPETIKAREARAAKKVQAQKEKEEEPVPPPKLVYQGEPLVLPLACPREHFFRAGIVCSDIMLCDLFLELTGIEQAAGKVFLIGNLHTSAATISSILLMTDDGGLTWEEPLSRMAGGFELIQFFDDEHGWIGGQEGQLDSSARPFLLTTHHGGTRWERRDIWPDEERSGAILEFYFDSETHGFLIVDLLISQGDPYELYETMNGGRSWSIRQITSRKPVLQNLPLDPKQLDWRVREDAESGTYEVEKRHGDRWERAARFAVRVGTCLSMEEESELGPPPEREPATTPELEPGPAPSPAR